MSPVTAGTNGGVTWRVELEREWLLPGQATDGSVTVTPNKDMEIRGCVAALIATEQWQTTETDGKRTRTVTHTEELQRLPVVLSGPTTLVGGVERTFPLQVPVPPLGPATFEGTVIRLTWELEIKLDRYGLDPAWYVPIGVLQPTALLKAGVVQVGEFGLYETADVADNRLDGSVTLRPMPLCVGEVFEGSVETGGIRPSKLRAIRLELIVTAKATVSSGLEEKILVWGYAYPPDTTSPIQITGRLPTTCVPTIELPHGRADATFEVIFDRAFDVDYNLVRDVTVASTTEM